jgi:hypothetical protein
MKLKCWTNLAVVSPKWHKGTWLVGNYYNLKKKIKEIFLSKKSNKWK